MIVKPGRAERRSVQVAASRLRFFRSRRLHFASYHGRGLFNYYHPFMDEPVRLPLSLPWSALVRGGQS